jgi:hypothetical protein
MRLFLHVLVNGAVLIFLNHGRHCENENFSEIQLDEFEAGSILTSGETELRFTLVMQNPSPSEKNRIRRCHLKLISLLFSYTIQ